METKRKMKKKKGRFSLKQLLRQLGNRVRVHVSPERGITNDFVARYCKKLCNDDFLGVYSADCLPVRFARHHRFTTIVNLGEVKGVRGSLPVGHFVTLVGSPGKVRYIDPYGLPVVQRHVKHFLEQTARPVTANTTQIQDFASIACGLYAILFAKYFEEEPAKFKLNFLKRDLKKNDKLCVEYIRRFLR